MSDKAQGQVVKVPCKGGPHADNVFTVHSWGTKPAPNPPEVAYPNHDGRYILCGGVYVWETS